MGYVILIVLPSNFLCESIPILNKKNTHSPYTKPLLEKLTASKNVVSSCGFTTNTGHTAFIYSSY